jgi:hypothetical protein
LRGGDVLEKKAKEVRGKWTPFKKPASWLQRERTARGACGRQLYVVVHRGEAICNGFVNRNWPIAEDDKRNVCKILIMEQRGAGYASNAD